MRALDHDAYAALIEGAVVLSRDEHGDKVLLTPQGRIIKLFRRKRLLSSAMFLPYAVRFARAAARLADLGFTAPKVEAVYRIPSIKRHAVVYPMVAGVCLRAALEKPERRDDLLSRLARFMARLHAKGVYFRAFHLGNVLVWMDEELALIDISEARFARRALTPAWRARNFRPLTSYQEDRQSLTQFGVERFLRLYLERAGLPVRQQDAFLRRLATVHPIYSKSAHSIASSSS